MRGEGGGRGKATNATTKQVTTISKANVVYQNCVGLDGSSRSGEFVGSDIHNSPRAAA